MLVVEDDPLLWNALRARAAARGWDVVVCTDGNQGLDMLGSRKFDVVLLDLVLPGRDGYSLLAERAKTVNGATPVIVLTNLRQPEHLDRAIKLGAAGCLVKSQVSLQTLLMNVEEYAKKR